jgi:predicted nucleic acid-binding protein
MYILDTDFIFAYFDSKQTTHTKAGIIVEKFGDQETIISNLVKQELATVISYKVGYKEAKEVIENLNLFEPTEIFFEPQEIEQIWHIFWSYQKKNISFIDCSNLYLAQKYKCKIASFDSFYSQNLLLKAHD